MFQILMFCFLVTVSGNEVVTFKFDSLPNCLEAREAVVQRLHNISETKPDDQKIISIKTFCMKPPTLTGV